MSMLGKRIREQRDRIGITQDELAIRVGYKSRSSINKIEIGINDIPQSKVKAFAVALHTTPAYLLDWENGPAEEQSTSIDVPDEFLMMAHKMRNLTDEQRQRVYQLINKTVDEVIELLETNEDK